MEMSKQMFPNPQAVAVPAPRLDQHTCEAASNKSLSQDQKCQCPETDTEDRMIPIRDHGQEPPAGLESSDDQISTSACCGCIEAIAPSICHPHGRQWLTFTLFWSLIAAGSICLIVFALPALIDNVIDPTLNRIKAAMTPAEIGIIIILTCIIPPIVLIPDMPCLWLAALVYNFGIAMLVVTIGTTLAMAIIYCIGRKLLYHTLSRWLQRYKPSKVRLRKAIITSRRCINWVHACTFWHACHAPVQASAEQRRHPHVLVLLQALLLASDRTGPAKLSFLMRLGPLPYEVRRMLAPHLTSRAALPPACCQARPALLILMLQARVAWQARGPGPAAGEDAIACAMYGEDVCMDASTHR